MSNPLGIPVLTRSIWHDFLRARRALFIYEVLFKLFEAWLFVPAAAVMFSLLLAGSGRVAVSNWEILDFLLTPFGLLYAALLGIVAAALFLLEQAGIMFLAALGHSPERPTTMRIARVAVRQMMRVGQLGAVQAALLALTLVPFVLLAILTYAVFLSKHDIYFYITDRPPNFWIAAGIGAVLVLAAGAVVVVLCVRWAFALPILLFEHQPARAALRASRDRVRGAGWKIGFALVGWQVLTFLIGGLLLAAFRFAAAAVLRGAEENRLALVMLLVSQGGLVASISFASVVGQGLLARRLYLVRSEQAGIARPPGIDLAAGSGAPIPPWSWRLAGLTLPIVMLGPLAVWAELPRYVEVGRVAKVTAHRGHSRAAPENTLSAIRKAIESGADYAEIDVLQTADGVVVLLHDSDLKRVAGDSRRIDEVTFDQVRTLDVGSWFAPAFAGERIPTLAEAIELARGRIKLNIELKYYGPDRGLALAAANLVGEKQFESECLITSFNYEALGEVKRVNPKLRTGLIIAHVLGDVNRLEIDAISVRLDGLTDEMLREAHHAGRDVHVWTVNDPGQMLRLMKRGVDNIITNDPDLAIRVRNDWLGLTGAERLLLSSRLVLGLDP